MRGYRFYLEYASPQDKRKGTVKNPGPHSGNVVAAMLDGTNGYRAAVMYQDMHGGAGWHADAVASLAARPNGPVCCTTIDVLWLRENCRRIPERLAREIHPALFAYLEG